TCTRYPLTPDEPDRIRQAIRTAVAENDLVIVSAGSSAGTRDYTADVIGELGEVLIHGVAIKPGKPVIIGKINEKPVIGMPGYPLGALTVIRELLLPLLSRCGLFVPEPGSVPARLTSTLHSDVGTDEFVLLSLGKISDRFVATPQSRGSGIQMSAVRANGYLRIPSSVEGYEAGEEVQVTLMVPGSGAESSVLVTGSHDPVLDYLSELAQRGGVEIHSTHVGSMGGVLALKRGDCHAAPMHLLSPDGDYNREYLEKYLPGEDISLLCIAQREQGIASREGYSLSDLPDIRFINRQKGSGTRILLDYELRRAGISPDQIAGYDREVTTHLAVALAVKSGEADAGMCVYSAARALGLAFVPVARERYELAIPQETLSDPRIGVIVDAVRSEEFKSVLERLGGYDSTETGVLRRVP
ncbi:MAG: LysR family transcriptional regulator, partial [Methanosaeta sp. SDB]